MSIRHESQTLQKNRTCVLNQENDLVATTTAKHFNAPLPGTRMIVELFESQVDRTPDGVAVRVGSQYLTYAQLNRQANQLAHYLKGLGVEQNIPVGICLPREIELAVAVLAVLKTGSAYVPLDPAYPNDRLRVMLADSRAPFVLSQQSQQKLTDLFVEFHGCVVSVDSLQRVIEGCPDHNPQVTIEPNSLAYVMYTSGSTGQPKGIAMPHRALSNLIDWHCKHPILGQPAVTLQYSALSFDVSFQEFFSTWCTGGELLLLDDRTRRDLYAVCELIKQARVERLFMPFVALQHLAGLIAADSQGGYYLRQLVTAGEQLYITDAIRNMMMRLDGCTLHNHYGPTETHVVSEFILAGDPLTWPLVAPIGEPIANVQLHILDEQLCCVPEEVVGELYIGGAALAAGYLHRPQLTAERFILDPYSKTPGARIYRTGDLVRRQADGNLLFLGRKDQQVKLRGFRVELGEVEATLAQSPLVSACVAIVREDQPGRQRLVAYWVAKDSNSASADALRKHLAQTLPDYMIPAVFVQLAALPISPAGKVDRTALPLPISVETDPATFVSALPPTPTERILMEIWSDVLAISTIGVHDNYFEVGGDSILAIQIAVKANQRGLRVTPGQLMEHPTIAQLAMLADTSSTEHGKEQVTTSNSLHVQAQIGYQPTDFPNANLNQQELDQLLAEIRELGAESK